jgi:hypothetical protein
MKAEVEATGPSDTDVVPVGIGDERAVPAGPLTLGPTLGTT